MALSGPRLAVTNRTAESWWLFLAHVWPQQIVLPSLGGSFWPSLGRNKSYCRVSLALSGPRLAVTNRTAESWWLFLAVTNRTAESWWPFLAHVWPYQILLPNLGGSFWPTLGRNKSYCRTLCRNESYYRVSVALSGQFLAVTNRTAESWWLFLANSWP